jgi:hypothetical protein
MKNILLFLCISCLFLTTIVHADDDPDITFEIIVKYGNHGGYDVAVLEVLHDVSALESYLAGTGYDTSLHPPFGMPDFTSETIVALVTEYGGGPIHYRRTVETIKEGTGSIIVEAINDTLLNDGSISVQQGYNVTLVAIPRTDKTIILHEKSEVVSVKHGKRLRKVKRTGLPENKRYTIQGRLLGGPVNTHAPVVGSNGAGGTMRIFMHR